MTVLIGLMGPAGSGKSTIAQYLQDNYGARRYSFAGPLKEFTKNAFDFTHEQIYGTQEQKEAPDERYGGHSARWFLQRIGTEGGRKTFGEQFWVKQCLDAIHRDGDRGIAVIDDVRFPNEAEAVQRWSSSIHCGYVWKLLPVEKNSSADTSHASEQGWMTAPWDFTIAPAKPGLPELFRLVEDACLHCGLKAAL